MRQRGILVQIELIVREAARAIWTEQVMVTGLSTSRTRIHDSL
jgi:hypothetical protein